MISISSNALQVNRLSDMSQGALLFLAHRGLAIGLPGPGHWGRLLDVSSIEGIKVAKAK